MRTGFHQAEVDPEAALALAEALLPTEPRDDAIAYTLAWALRSLVPVSDDRAATTARLHRVARARLGTAPPGSAVALAAFQAVVDSCPDGDTLGCWLDGALPAGLAVDEDLRWRLLVRMAVLGATDRAGLDHALGLQPTAVAQVAHTKAVASLADPAAKAWAWGHFTGAHEAPNYLLEAAGSGLWRTGQEELTEEYVDALLRAAARHRRDPRGMGPRRGGRLVLPRHLAHPGHPGACSRPGRAARPRALPAALGHGPRRRPHPQPRRTRSVRSRGDGARMTGQPTVRARRPGPVTRTRVRELSPDGDREREDRLATEEPLEIRLAWPGRPAERVWLTMRTPGNDFELAAGFLAHEGLLGPGPLGASSGQDCSGRWPTAPTPTSRRSRSSTWSR